jgi:hypothetical protein
MRCAISRALGAACAAVPLFLAACRSAEQQSTPTSEAAPRAEDVPASPRARADAIATTTTTTTTTTTDASTTAPTAALLPAERWTQLTPKVRCDSARGIVEFEAVAVLKTGFLEQYVCTVGTREHEALFAFDGKASDVHAALLLAGLEPGRPGYWREVEGANGERTIELVAPSGPEVAIRVRLADGTERGVEWFARASPVQLREVDAATTPPSRFVFAGSKFVTNRRTGAERYAADSAGSLVGLVTFGDETIASVDVIPDKSDVAAPIWEAFTERMPEPGTIVTIVIAAAKPDDRARKTSVNTCPTAVHLAHAATTMSPTQRVEIRARKDAEEVAVTLGSAADASVSQLRTKLTYKKARSRRKPTTEPFRGRWDVQTRSTYRSRSRHEQATTESACVNFCPQQGHKICESLSYDT